MNSKTYFFLNQRLVF